MFDNAGKLQRVLTVRVLLYTSSEEQRSPSRGRDPGEPEEDRSTLHLLHFLTIAGI